MSLQEQVGGNQIRILKNQFLCETSHEMQRGRADMGQFLVNKMTLWREVSNIKKGRGQICRFIKDRNA